MTDPPRVIRQFLESRAIAECSPAYVRVDSDAAVLEWGGPLARYGISEPTRGDNLGQVIPILLGWKPADGWTDHLPRIETDSGTVADVFLLDSAGSKWVLLLDASRETERERRLQQISHELQLLQEQRSTVRGESRGEQSAVLAALGMAVLEPAHDDGFRLVGTPPQWLTQLWPSAKRALDDFRPHRLSPFLEHFLVDARRCWRTGAGSVRSGIWTETGADGQDWYLEAAATCFRDRRLLVIEEISATYQEREQLLQRARESALVHQQFVKEIDKKDVLLHCIVHDLRSPMISAHSCLQLLEMEDLGGKAAETVAAGLRELERQDRLIRTILDVFAADLDASAVADQTPSTTDIALCAREVAESVGPAYALRGVRLELDISPDIDGALVRGERLRATRVMANLLDNALRHSKMDSTVRLSLTAEDAAIEISVEDEGRGVPPGLAGRLFDRFTQLSGQRGSTGLGLHFCRITVEGWGGTIGHSNRPEGGSRFWFRLPRP